MLWNSSDAVAEWVAYVLDICAHFELASSTTVPAVPAYRSHGVRATFFRFSYQYRRNNIPSTYYDYLKSQFAFFRETY